MVEETGNARTPFSWTALSSLPFSFQLVQNRAHDASDDAPLHGFLPLCGHVLHELVRQFGNRQRLQPDSPWPAKRREEDSVTAKNHVLDSRHGRNLKGNARLERADMSRMHPQSFARLQILHDQLAGKLDPCGPGSADVLQQEPVASEDSCPQRLLEADADLNLRRRTQKTVPMNHVFVSRANFDRHNMPRQFC